ncbi:glycosyltransferase family 2 protein [Algoriphagus sediminis]|uniref:Glycosyltransferase family A protein n=1 Tax=Algoriphagus sediminis TaxID=3057113 RepID=A0ABT7YDZ9_9BACT|nr:glycosyltransferase family A protein [Algoriphagus sediminis]MDN3204757.1 glycosyltransferase family A protein [Algoriphagus sediminis]
MKVSVIIPVFNNSKFLTETLDSVQNQTYKNWECIVVDDGSEDESKEIARSFCRNKRFKFLERNPELPKGANSCRNLGAKESEGDLFLFLDGDDLLSAECLEHRLKGYSCQDLVIYNSGTFESDTSFAKEFFPNLNKNLDSKDYLKMFLEYFIPWNINSTIWKREFFLDLGGFDVGLQRFQDVDLHIRALSRPGIKLGFDKADVLSSFYRRSEYHQKMSVEKRRFLLDQGLFFIYRIKENLRAGDLINLQGLLLYLYFRFEEVFEESDTKAFQQLIAEIKDTQTGKISRELKYVEHLYTKFMNRPSRLRKVLSYGTYRIYRNRQIKSYLN